MLGELITIPLALPIEGLDKPLDRRAVLLDITCDSDGIIDHYVDGDVGVETTMPMPAYDPGISTQ